MNAAEGSLVNLSVSPIETIFTCTPGTIANEVLRAAENGERILKRLALEALDGSKTKHFDDIGILAKAFIATPQPIS